jgi:hypothetical protein
MLRTAAGGLWQAVPWLALSGALACSAGHSTGFASNADTLGGDAGGADDAGARGPCSGLACQTVSCPDGTHTQLSGVVYSPATQNADPIYNAFVYVPNGPVDPFPPGVSCDACGAVTSGSPIVTAITGSDGRFVLSDVPVGNNIPIVIQIGRWRKQLVMPEVAPCTDNKVPAGLTHLPANQKAGDIPHIAIATGALDPLECVLVKMGIEQSEFTTPDQGGRIHVYRSNGSILSDPTPPASALWSNLDTLKQYDIVLLPCEGEPLYKPVQATQNVIDYTSAGGRVFTTHYGYVWIQGAQQPFASTANWTPDDPANMPTPLVVDINASFPKGAALADWLYRLGATPTMGQLSIDDARRDAPGTNAAGTPWLTSSAPNASVQEYTFNTPVGTAPAQQCGRVSYSDFHVNIDGLTTSDSITFPGECEGETNTLTPQEKVIEFMLFDLASCVQDETKAPTAPK